MRELRLQRFSTGTALARALQWSQSRVSKIETAHTLPRRRDIQAWLAATGASDRTAADIWRLWDEARLDPATGSVVRERDGVARASRTSLDHTDWLLQRAEADLAATDIREHQTSMIMLMLATAEYAEAMLGAHMRRVMELTDDQAHHVLTRREMQQRALLRPDCECHFIIEESALYNTAVGTGVLSRQLDRLIDLVDSLPQLDLAVRPRHRVNSPWTPCGFVVHDHATVTVQGYGNPLIVDMPDEVATWIRGFALAREHSTDFAATRQHLVNARDHIA
jgi:hypothetical protein